MIVTDLRASLIGSALAAGLLSAVPAMAMPASCQQDFAKYSGDREAAIQRINTFNKKRPSAFQACAAFGNLTGIEARMLKWMNENKEWCQFPEQVINQLKEATAQTSRVRGQVCTAAKREAQGGGAARGAPPPGSGVRLPQGAL